MKKVITFAIFVLAISLAHASSDTTALSVQVGSTKYSAAIKVVDQTNGAAISATITNVVINNSQPEVISLSTASSVTGATLIKATGVAPGTGTATVTCDVSYTDPGDGLQKNESKTIVIAYTVVGTPHGVSLSLVFN